MLAPAQIRVAEDKPEHLEAWLKESGRKWIVLNSLDLVRALSWPDGVAAFQKMVGHYGQYRATQETGRVEIQTNDVGNPVKVPILKGEILEPEEKLELYAQLKAELTEIGLLR